MGGKSPPPSVQSAAWGRDLNAARREALGDDLSAVPGTSLDKSGKRLLSDIARRVGCALRKLRAARIVQGRRDKNRRSGLDFLAGATLRNLPNAILAMPMARLHVVTMAFVFIVSVLGSAECKAAVFESERFHPDVYAPVSIERIFVLCLSPNVNNNTFVDNTLVHFRFTCGISR